MCEAYRPGVQRTFRKTAQKRKGKADEDEDDDDDDDDIHESLAETGMKDLSRKK